MTLLMSRTVPLRASFALGQRQRWSRCWSSEARITQGFSARRLPTVRHHPGLAELHDALIDQLGSSAVSRRPRAWRRKSRRLGCRDFLHEPHPEDMTALLVVEPRNVWAT